jgi:hypothetical protein
MFCLFLDAVLAKLAKLEFQNFFNVKNFQNLVFEI